MKKSDEQHQVARSVIGRADKRVEDARLVKGAGRFTSDIKQPNALHVTFIRSTIAYGKIERVDLKAALDRNGVVAAFSGRDVSQLGNLSVAKPLSHTNAPVFPILADDYVHAVGQPAAAVISQTPHQGLGASELIEVAITEEDAKTADDSFYIAASQRWQAGDTPGAFDAAAFIVEVECQHPRLSPCPLEPRAITAKYDNGNLVVWLSTQTPHRARSELSSILNIDAARIRVIAPDVGGAFGMKASLYPEDVFVCWAALQLERTLTWTATRSEDFLAATHGRGSNSKGRLALDADGHFLGLEADIKAPLGHWMPTSAAIPAWNAARILPGPYAVKNVDIKTSATLSPTAAVGIYRGAGRPEAAMLMERLVEKAAAMSGVSAQDIRTKNFHCSTQFPVTKPTGNILDSGTYEHALTTLCESAAYQQIRSRRDQLRSAGECAGIGMAFFVEPSGRGWESAQVTLHKNGTATAATGSSTQGQGRVTSYRQIIADVLDVHVDHVTVDVGDTASCPAGIGALASRSTPIGGSALYIAAQKVKKRAESASAEDYPLTENTVYETKGEAWGYGCHAALVSIDVETGVLTALQLVCIDDAGVIINPALAHGQLVGGIAQGVGEALMENLVYDDYGQLITGSLMDYALPRASDMPAISAMDICTPSPFNPLGAKGVGEAGTIGAPAALINAAHDALAPLGVNELTLPLTSETLWRAIQNAQKD